MTTEAKLEANRANAAHSTGPRTPEGKARVSRNAVKHGLTSSKLYIREDEQEEFDSFQQDLHASILPHGAIEEDLFARLLHAAWNLRRLRQLEEALFAGCDDPFTNEETAAKMNSYARHSSRFERAYRGAMRELRQLQTTRNLSAAITGDAPVVLTATTNTAELLKQTQTLRRQQASEAAPAEDSGLDEAGRRILEDVLASAGPAPRGPGGL